MSKMHQAYIEETKGRGISYTDWMEKKVVWFASGYEEIMQLIVDAHDTLRHGTPEQQRKLADEIAAEFKDTGLFDDYQPQEEK